MRMNKGHNVRSALALGVCLFAVATATAQEVQERSSPDTVVVVGSREAEPAAGYRPDVVTTTGPWGGRKVEDVPYTITVLPSEFIENSGARNLDQLFAMTPLVQPGQSQDINNIAQATLRGFNVARAYVNGVQNNNIGMGVFIEEIDQLEILNGLSGFLYGASPVGGVINYQLKRPTAYDLRNLTIGNYGGEQYYAHADIGGTFDADGRFGYRLNLLTQDGDTQIDEQSLCRNMVSGSADWRPTDDMVVELFLSKKDFHLEGRQFQFFLGGNLPPSGWIADLRAAKHLCRRGLRRGRPKVRL
jgi:iron complex outermembrane receptor protein